MKTLILYYSLSGKTRALARRKAEQLGAELIEIQETRKRSMLSAFTSGAYHALRSRPVPIRPLDVDMDAFEKIILLAPIWAGYPAPALLSVFPLLPKGKDVELVLTSSSGNSQRSAEKTQRQVEEAGCRVADYTDINTKKLMRQ